MSAAYTLERECYRLGGIDLAYVAACAQQMLDNVAVGAGIFDVAA